MSFDYPEYDAATMGRMLEFIYKGDYGLVDHNDLSVSSRHAPDERSAPEACVYLHRLYYAQAI
jgi:hypothetical protein